MNWHDVRKTMSFKQIVNGSISYKFVLIEDSSNGQTDVLLKAFVHEGISCGKEVHIFCFDHFPDFIEKNLKVQKSTKLYTHDFFSDSVGWLKESNSQNDVANKNLFASLQKQSTDAAGLLVIIDSLTSFMLSYSFQEVYRQIHQFIYSDVNRGQLGDCIKQLVGVLHPNTITNYDAVFLQLRYLATTFVTAMPSRKQNQGTVTLRITYRKSNGKFVKQTEECWIDAHCLLQSKKIETAKDYCNKSDNNDLPSHLTTFNISLKEEEKVARSKLVLPYIKTESEKAGGSIYYEPDENDDWDEEDPDDDLDI